MLLIIFLVIHIHHKMLHLHQVDDISLFYSISYYL